MDDELDDVIGDEARITGDKIEQRASAVFVRRFRVGCSAMFKINLADVRDGRAVAVRFDDTLRIVFPEPVSGERVLDLLHVRLSICYLSTIGKGQGNSLRTVGGAPAATFPIKRNLDSYRPYDDRAFEPELPY